MSLRFSLALAGACALAAPVFAAKSTSDIIGPQKRQASVEAAERLTRPPVPATLPAEPKSPFSPPDFDKAPPDAKGDGKGDGKGKGQPIATPGDREMLEMLAARIPSTGTIGIGDKLLLVVAFGGKTHRFQNGDVFTVTNPTDNRDYELELVAVTSTTFTLRYRGEEVTRPVRSAK